MCFYSFHAQKQILLEQTTKCPEYWLQLLIILGLALSVALVSQWNHLRGGSSLKLVGLLPVRLHHCISQRTTSYFVFLQVHNSSLYGIFFTFGQVHHLVTPTSLIRFRSKSLIWLVLLLFQLYNPCYIDMTSPILIFSIIITTGSALMKFLSYFLITLLDLKLSAFSSKCYYASTNKDVFLWS